MNRMEAAFDRVGNHPVLDQLENWMNSSRKSHRRRVADLIEVLTDFVNSPQEMTERELKYLRNDIWELKHGKLRILFGGGECLEADFFGSQKPTLSLPSGISQASPSMTCGRATNSFHKNTDESPRRVIDLATGIMKEDKLR